MRQHMTATGTGNKQDTTATGTGNKQDTTAQSTDSTHGSRLTPLELFGSSVS